MWPLGPKSFDSHPKLTWPPNRTYRLSARSSGTLRNAGSHVDQLGPQVQHQRGLVDAAVHPHPPLVRRVGLGLAALVGRDERVGEERHQPVLQAQLATGDVQQRRVATVPVEEHEPLGRQCRQRPADVVEHREQASSPTARPCPQTRRARSTSCTRAAGAATGRARRRARARRPRPPRRRSPGRSRTAGGGRAVRSLRGVGSGSRPARSARPLAARGRQVRPGRTMTHRWHRTMPDGLRRDRRSAVATTGSSAPRTSPGPASRRCCSKPGTSVGGCASTVDALGARVNICNCDHVVFRTTPVLDELGLAEPRAPLSRCRARAGPGVVERRGRRGPSSTTSSARSTRSRLIHPDEVDGYRRYARSRDPVAELVLEMAQRAAHTGRRAEAARRPPRPRAWRRCCDGAG